VNSCSSTALISMSGTFGLETTSSAESRFQRLFNGDLNPWGDAPGSH
jgi:hypothetical protein